MQLSSPSPPSSLQPRLFACSPTAIPPSAGHPPGLRFNPNARSPKPSAAIPETALPACDPTATQSAAPPHPQPNPHHHHAFHLTARASSSTTPAAS